MTVLRQRNSQDTQVHPRREAHPKPVTVFVDWAAQMHNAGVSHTQQIVEGAQRTLSKTAQAVGRLLKAEESRFRVSFRLYHGWHKGWQETVGLIAARQAVGRIDFARLSEPHVDFSPIVAYGHTLLDALPERQTKSIHLPNTLRDQRRDEAPTEKMVDTAIAADLLAWARRCPSEWALVLAEDDDVVPPLFTAEAWIKPHGGRAILLRRRGATQYLKLDGLLSPMR